MSTDEYFKQEKSYLEIINKKNLDGIFKSNSIDSSNYQNNKLSEINLQKRSKMISDRVKNESIDKNSLINIYTESSNAMINK